jgi:hypothetical protein
MTLVVRFEPLHMATKRIGLHKKNVMEGAKIPSNSRQTIAPTHILQQFLKSKFFYSLSLQIEDKFPKFI